MGSATKQTRSIINRQAWQAAQRFELQEKERLRMLPHLSRSEANSLAHANARIFYQHEQQRLLAEI